tara:strand:- start:1731 stop:2225 length:495 start_codon:yes stop_codon:yes gene_type:complete
MNPILKVSKTLIRCPKDWLPDETSHLAVAIKPVKVWFPEDEHGEPHINNPDDGCGGGKYKTVNYNYFYATKNGEPVKEDLSNVLEGSAAYKAHRESNRPSDYNETANLFRELLDKARWPNHNRYDIWYHFKKKVDMLKEPEWSYIGLAWKQLYGSMPRMEEAGL